MQFFSTGALHDKIDNRDYNATPLLAVSLPVDWFNIKETPIIPIRDQQMSDACVSYAWSYYHEYIRPNHNFSRRALFSRIAQPYGAYIRDGGITITQIGQEIQDEVPDPLNPNPVNMRDKSGISSILAGDDRELDSWGLPNDIESVAKCARDYKGTVFGISGDSSFFQNPENPSIPKLAEWGHALYVPENGYHLHDGKRCILAQPSWNIGRQYFHHINEDYFNTGFTFNPWTLIPRKELIMEILQVEGEATLVVKNLDGKYYQIATAPELYPFVAKTLGLDGKSWGTISRAEVNLNLGGDLTAGLTFITK
jgi:hypothetical protein